MMSRRGRASEAGSGVGGSLVPAAPRLALTPPGRLLTRPARSIAEDPGPQTLGLIAEQAEIIGIELPDAFEAAARTAAKLTRQAPAIGGDRSLAAGDRQHQADQLRLQATRSRRAALRSLAGVATGIEDAGRALVTEALDTIEAANLPADVTDLETAARRGGGKMVEQLVALRVADDTCRRVWDFLDQLRTLSVLPPTFDASERLWLVSDERQDALVHPAHGSGYVVPAAHRFANPGIVPLAATAIEALRAGAAPGVFDRDQARAAVRAHVAAVVESLNSLRP